MSYTEIPIIPVWWDDREAVSGEYFCIVWRVCGYAHCFFVSDDICKLVSTCTVSPFLSDLSFYFVSSTSAQQFTNNHWTINMIFSRNQKKDTTEHIRISSERWWRLLNCKRHFIRASWTTLQERRRRRACSIVIVSIYLYMCVFFIIFVRALPKRCALFVSKTE